MRKTVAKITIYLIIFFWLPFIITLCMNGVKGKAAKALAEDADSCKTFVPDYSSVTDFVTGTVAAYYEAGDSAEFLKAIGLIARTYVECIEKNGVESIPADFTLDYWNEKTMKKNWQENYEQNKAIIDEVVAEVLNKIIVYEGEPILPYVHNISAGFTRAGEKEYLQAVECKEDLNESNYLSKVKISEENLEKILIKKYGKIQYDNSAVASIQIISRDESGYITELIAGGETMTGEELANLLGLESSNFSIGREGDECIFNVKGKGLGYGLSISSARKKAENGAKCSDIIGLFYKNISITDV